jgi:hypothetical protein
MAMNMRYLLRTDGFEYEVVKPPTPKTEMNGAQRIDKRSKLPMWTVTLLQCDPQSESADQLEVSVVSEFVPPVRWREPVEVVDLEIIPWTQKDPGGAVRSGGAFRAASIRSHA